MVFPLLPAIRLVYSFFFEFPVSSTETAGHLGANELTAFGTFEVTPKKKKKTTYQYS